ncbi:DinB family protein [Reichenbachiella sp. MALMAid0571]|uniref:DinB family protein n=1 Tax=Reichenbachiella sp. MALMAid0571 TaxID=3143939 RepID=UPI0032DE4801
MESAFETLTTSRNLYLKFLENYTLEQLNTIPKGFNNNLIWNIGHIIVAQQRLMYNASGLPMYISDELLEVYKPGTKPTTITTQKEVDELKMLLISLVEKAKTDFAEGKFVSYNEYTTATGFHLKSVEDAMEFNNFHEGLHLGYMMSIRKFV